MPIPIGDWQQLTPNSQVAPVTLASAATIAPTTFLTTLTGNVAITTITPPIPGGHTICLIFAGTAGVATGGNINATVASVVAVAMLLVYNTVTGKYVPVM